MRTPEQRSLSPRERIAWRIVQAALVVVGLAIFALLFLAPPLGLKLFWSVLIPVAPALLVFAPGLWRNICPLASIALLPRHLGLSRRIRLTPAAQGILVVIALVLLLSIVPLRHVLLDVSGPATGVTLAAIGIAAILTGLLFEWKSGWCSGLCPIYPVETLYGSRPALTLRNAHCASCQRCTAVCPDSTPAMDPLVANCSRGHSLAGTLIVGGFPGYVWGWYQVPTRSTMDMWTHAIEAYRLPFAGLFATLLVFLALRSMMPRRNETVLVHIFAATAVSVYYWYRLPALIGYPKFPGEGVLVDLSSALPAWTPAACQVGTTALFFWWLVLRPAARASWSIRPPYADAAAATA